MLRLDIIHVVKPCSPIKALSGRDRAIRKWDPLEGGEVTGVSLERKPGPLPFGLHEMSCFVPPHAQLCALMLLLLKGSTLHSQATTNGDTSVNTDQISLAS